MTENKLEPCPGECDIVNMDHTKLVGEDKVPTVMINRTCRSCKLHWYGTKGVDVKKYTNEEWTKWIESAFNKEVSYEAA